MPACVILDANVLLSFLLSPDKQTAATQVVLREIAGEFVLVFPAGVAAEMRRKVREKQYFRERITGHSLENLIDLMQEIGLEPWEEKTWPVLASDPKDQYLLNAAAGNGVDFLITGDRRLIATGRGNATALIVSPAQFVLLEGLHSLD